MEKGFESQLEMYKYVIFLLVLFIVMSTLIQMIILFWILILFLNVMLVTVNQLIVITFFVLTIGFPHSTDASLSYKRNMVLNSSRESHTSNKKGKAIGKDLMKKGKGAYEEIYQLETQ